MALMVGTEHVVYPGHLDFRENQDPRELGVLTEQEVHEAPQVFQVCQAQGGMETSALVFIRRKRYLGRLETTLVLTWT